MIPNAEHARAGRMIPVLLGFSISFGRFRPVAASCLPEKATTA